MTVKIDMFAAIKKFLLNSWGARCRWKLLTISIKGGWKPEEL